MRVWRLFGFALAALGFVPVALQAADKTDVKQGYFNADFARFVHSSAAVVYPGLFRLHYSVCNVDEKNDLIFSWPKPGFGSGWDHPLKFGKCAAVSLDSEQTQLDTNAPITFTQSSKTHPASAYLPDLKRLGPSITRVQAWEKGLEPTLVELSIQVLIQDSSTATYRLFWSQGIPSVAIGFNVRDMPDGARQDMIDALVKSNAKVETIRAGDFIRASDRPMLSPAALESQYLRITPSEDQGYFVSFVVKGGSLSPRVEPLLLLDREGGVLLSAPYRGLR